ncbi:MAG: hypothetical protein AAB788_00985 [Patescibacteria group bacterium]
MPEKKLYEKRKTFINYQKIISDISILANSIILIADELINRLKARGKIIEKLAKK